jgi:isopropylmalate/homocitrate/citramalate synthase
MVSGKKDQVIMYDTTLRDGTQAEEINLQLMDKVAITHKLDDLGMDFIEAGWPGPPSGPPGARGSRPQTTHRSSLFSRPPM